MPNVRLKALRLFANIHFVNLTLLLTAIIVFIVFEERSAATPTTANDLSVLDSAMNSCQTSVYKENLLLYLYFFY